VFVAALLRQYRQQRALSQDELAEAAGVSRTTILKLEAGQRQPRPKTLRKLARALRVKPSALLQ